MTSSLLSRLQSLTGPDREIDVEIALAVHPWLKDCPRDDRDGDPGWMTKDGRVYALRYTASIDAALTLMPEGAQWEVGSGSDGFMATIYVDTGSDVAVIEWFGAATPAIALLITILKTQEESKP